MRKEKTMAILKFEGQTLTIPDRMAAAENEKALLEFVASFSPELANATVYRSQDKGTTIVSLTKRAGTKGAGAIQPAVQSAAVQELLLSIALPPVAEEDAAVALTESLVTALTHAPNELNPTIALTWQLRREGACQPDGELPIERLLMLQTAIDTALEEGENVALAISQILDFLKILPPIAATRPLSGF
jgi:hypothetical protein